MIDTRRPPPRGAFDYLLHGVEKTIWRDASLGEVPPPTQPPEPPRPQQVRIEIDIAEQRPQRQASQPATGGWGVGRLILAILVVSLLSALLGGCTAHAQSRFESYRERRHDLPKWHDAGRAAIQRPVLPTRTAAPPIRPSSGRTARRNAARVTIWAASAS